jgi:hypothetical protein
LRVASAGPTSSCCAGSPAGAGRGSGPAAARVRAAGAAGHRPGAGCRDRRRWPIGRARPGRAAGSVAGVQRWHRRSQAAWRLVGGLHGVIPVRPRAERREPRPAAIAGPQHRDRQHRRAGVVDPGRPRDVLVHRDARRRGQVRQSDAVRRIAERVHDGGHRRAGGRRRAGRLRGSSVGFVGGRPGHRPGAVRGGRLRGADRAQAPAQPGGSISRRAPAIASMP